MAAVTPMMQQYEEIKKKYSDCILMFRLGDFYEMFNEDAKVASKELELTLTGRASGNGERAPMCGVPFHSADSYISRLVGRGYKVAICEQLEDPTATKNIVARDVIRVVTPGTLTDEKVLKEKENNFLSCVYAVEGETALAFSDVSTGELLATTIKGENLLDGVLNELACFSPKEVVLSPYADKLYKSEIRKRFNTYIPLSIDEYYVKESCSYIIQKELSVSNEASNSLSQSEALMVCVGAILLYMREMQKTSAGKICDLKIYEPKQCVGLDMATRRNLEIVETMRDKEKRGSLLWVLDKTKTSMGGRLLKQWVEKPLINIEQIRRRHESVGELKDNIIARDELLELFDGVYDLKRIIGRIGLSTISPRDMLSLKESARRLPGIKEKLKSFNSSLICAQSDNIDELVDIYDLLESAIDENAPVYARDGGIIKKGFNSTADEYREAKENGSDWLAQIQAEEREKTGIKTLKVGYNKVFGYYIEVSKGQVSLVPDTYIRRQTLVNGERYITEKLKEIENIIIGAQDKLLNLEIYIFEQIKKTLYDNLERLKKTADAIAVLDVLCSLAYVAERQNYCMPEMIESGEIQITDGRHPVVEKMVRDEIFVPNDTTLDTSDNRLMIITGPNMAGKSTYMRQVALISLMAQIGSFVPATSARLGIVDNIFTRVGAADDLASGQSTFMFEMSEVSNILKNATKNSLIIFDEIGRGTSTFDGLAIAWAVAEFVADKKKLGANTLFATHYHEMTELESKLDGIKNYHVAVKKRGEEITFLRKIIKGCADGSYGIEVAALAGVPKEVLQRAKKILGGLEMREAGGDAPKKSQSEKSEQNSFGGIFENEMISELRDMDVTTYTPIEALNKLYELSNKAKQL